MAAVAQTIPWLALVMGNTRLHWALFIDDALRGTWHTPHLSQPELNTLIAHQFAVAGWQSFTTMPVPTLLDDLATHRAAEDAIALYAASVVPAQLDLWQPYPGLQVLTLEQMPLANLYSTLGIDRVLNLLGAGDRYGWPVLVIDAGTALTFTAGDAEQFLGGAILPGLATQLKALREHTASLPLVTLEDTLPVRWAQTTPEAIKSGVVHAVTAVIWDFLTDWYHQHPNGTAVTTGGDSARLLAWLTAGDRPIQLHHDPDLMFGGMQVCRQYRLATDH